MGVIRSFSQANRSFAHQNTSNSIKKPLSEFPSLQKCWPDRGKLMKIQIFCKCVICHIYSVKFPNFSLAVQESNTPSCCSCFPIFPLLHSDVANRFFCTLFCAHFSCFHLGHQWAYKKISGFIAILLIVLPKKVCKNQFNIFSQFYSIFHFCILDYQTLTRRF